MKSRLDDGAGSLRMIGPSHPLGESGGWLRQAAFSRLARASTTGRVRQLCSEVGLLREDPAVAYDTEGRLLAAVRTNGVSTRRTDYTYDSFGYLGGVRKDPTDLGKDPTDLGERSYRPWVPVVGLEIAT